MAIDPVAPGTQATPGKPGPRALTGSRPETERVLLEKPVPSCAEAVPVTPAVPQPKPEVASTPAHKQTKRKLGRPRPAQQQAVQQPAPPSVTITYEITYRKIYGISTYVFLLRTSASRGCLIWKSYGRKLVFVIPVFLQHQGPSLFESLDQRRPRSLVKTCWIT